jgi:hypothetical protein
MSYAAVVIFVECVSSRVLVMTVWDVSDVLHVVKNVCDVCCNCDVVSDAALHMSPVMSSWTSTCCLGCFSGREHGDYNFSSTCCNRGIPIAYIAALGKA